METEEIEPQKETLSVWLFMDEGSSFLAHDRAEGWNDEHPEGPHKRGVDVDYEDAEDAFREAFPGVDLRFSRGKNWPELKNGSPDYYVFDIGGMDYGGSSRGNFARGVIDQVEDHPDTWFVPWSAFTFRYVEGALCDLLGDDCQVNGRLPPNVLVLDDKEVYSGVLEHTVMDRLKAAYQARRKPSPSSTSSSPTTSSSPG